MEEMSFIPTRASLLKENSAKEFETVVFESYKPKVKKSEVFNNAKREESEEVGFSVRQTKHEIIKFGMSGFDGKRKEEAKVQLAIKLGAKPPKNKYKNYKELMQERKKDKQSAARINSLQQTGKNSVGKSTAKGKSYDRKRRKQKSDGILDIYGKIQKRAAKV